MNDISRTDRLQSPRWELDKAERTAIRFRLKTANGLALLPVSRLSIACGDLMLLTGEESCLFALGLADSIVGNLSRSLYYFDQLLAARHHRSDGWLACNLLWCSALSVYLCDSDRCLRYADEIETLGLGDIVPEAMLIRSLAIRVSGDPSAAAAKLEHLRKDESALFPHERVEAEALWLESSVAADVYEPTEDDIRGIDRNDRGVDHGTRGVLLVSLYRMLISARTNIGGARSPDEILDAMDRAPAYQRPLMTLLLEDILPRPLAGVVRAT
jgi:hypothetical protein